MNRALHAWEAGNAGLVEDLLRRHLPVPGPNQTDLRRFEWYYLFRLCSRTLQTPTLEQSKFTVFSADGKMLASADNSTVKLWDAHS